MTPRHGKWYQGKGKRREERSTYNRDNLNKLGWGHDPRVVVLMDVNG